MDIPEQDLEEEPPSTQTIIDSKSAELADGNWASLTLTGADEISCLPMLVEMHRKLLKQKLKRLNLSGGPLDQVWQSIFLLRRITHLLLNDCFLEYLPEGLFSLSALELLSLANNSLSEIPPAIASLDAIQTLDIQENHFTEIPLVITELRSLETLNVSDNDLGSLPHQIGRLTNLRTLFLYRTGLSKLPDSLSQLRELDTLVLWNNLFSEIPPVVFDLAKLRSLSFSNNSTGFSKRNENSITTIDIRITLLENLEELEMSGNPVSNPPMEIVVKGPKAIRSYFAQINSDGEDFLYEAKLLILGEGGAGKTTLSNKLIDSNYLLCEELSTQGIRIQEWRFSLAKDTNFRVNIWDFGGQEIYHATHQFFLTDRSLYLLVADARREDTDFYYWLNVVSVLSDNSPLIIVSNERQGRRRDIHLSTLREEFSNLISVVNVDLASNAGLEELTREIRNSIRSLPHIGQALPKTWVKVRARLEDDARNFISFHEYLRICAEEGFTSIDAKLQLSDYLHDLGVCLHFQGDLLLREFVILKPKWGTDAAYRVLDSVSVVHNKGKFSKDDLLEIWSEPTYNGMHAALLQLMMKFHLCYQLREGGSYIAPQLLADKRPIYEWSEKGNLQMRYQYPFMPKGIVTQLIVSMNRYIAKEDSVWKSGVILKIGRSRVEVLERQNEREISIRIAGNDKRDALAIVCYELDRINGSFRGLRFKKLVPCNCKGCSIGEKVTFYEADVLDRFIDKRQETIQCQISFEMVNVRKLLWDVSFPSKGTDAKLERGNTIIYGPVEQVVVSSLSGGEMSISKRRTDSKPTSAWANGSFYLFAGVVIVVSLGILARNISAWVLIPVLLASLILIPTIGALQLKQDAKLSDKSFLTLMKLTLKQLPLVRGNGVHETTKE